MAHAKLTQARMLDWIRACLDTDAPLPTDGAIMEAFRLPSVESARSLLADLAEAKAITITGYGADRAIVLGHVERTVTAVRPVPTVVKRSARAPVLADEEVTFAKIKAIIAGGKAALADKTPVVAPPVAPVPPAPAPEVKTAPAVTDEPYRKQVSFHITPGQFACLASRAGAASVPPGAKARELLIKALAPEPKTFVPAEITAAAIRAGVPICEFVRELLARGFAAYNRDAAECVF